MSTGQEMADPRRWLDDGSAEMREFVEAGGYGTFAGWVPEGGFMTSNVDGRPPAGSYFKDGKYLTLAGTDGRMAPPDYEIVGIDEPVTNGEAGSQTTTPGRMILKRRDQPEVAPPPVSGGGASSVEARPQPYDSAASTFNPLDYGTSEGFWSLADALGAPVKRYQAGDLSSWTGSAPPAAPSGEEEGGRRFAGSEKFRHRLTGARAAIAAIPGAGSVGGA